MTPRIMNLRTGLTTCLTCGQQYSWGIQVCPNAANHQPRRVMVQHIDGTQEIDPSFSQGVAAAVVERLEAAYSQLTPEQIALMEAMCAEQGGIVEHDDAYEGMWK